MRAIASISAFVLVVATSILAAPADAHASAEDDARLRAAIAGPERSKDLEEVTRLLDKGANPNARDEFGRTAVHYAAGGTTGRHGTGAIFQLLLARGGDCCMKDSQGDTPLHYAVAAANHSLSDSGDVEGRIRILLESGADPNEPNRRGYTPFHFSAKTDEFTRGTVVIGSLLQAGADLAAVAADGNTPLHLAAGIPVILDSGHGHHFFSVGWDAGEDTLTDEGIPGNDADVVEALLAGGANPNVVNNAGVTPLLVVLTIDSVSRLAVEAAVNSFLSAGADPNATRRDGLPPLHIVLNYPESRSTPARRMTQEGIALVEALLGAGADPDVKNPQGDTLLHVAVRQEWGEDMVEALLAGGADPCIRNDNERWVPEQLARGLGQSDVELALQLGGGYEDDCEKREEEELGLDRDERRRIQSCLNSQGFDSGAPDGLFGPRTRGAISAWQEAQGDGGEASGYLTQAELDDLLASCKSAAPTPLCTGEEDTPCWMETSNQPGCYVWNPNPAPEETVTWTGSCVDGKASGRGKLVWRFRRDGVSKTSEGEGEMREDNLVGHWVYRTSDGEVWEGPFVDGKRHGRFVKRGTKGEQWNCWSRGERVEPDHPTCIIGAWDGEMQTTKGIVLRSGPTDDYEEIGRLAIDDEVRVTRKARRWAWVETDSGLEGFAPLSALEELEKPTVAETEIKEPEIAAVVTEPKCRFGDEIWPGYINHERRTAILEWSNRIVYKNFQERKKINIEIAKELGLVVEKCWVELKDVTGCHVFIGNFYPARGEGAMTHGDVEEIVLAARYFFTSGSHIPKKCVNGLAHGETESPSYNKSGSTAPMNYIKGKRHSKYIQVEWGGGYWDSKGKYENGLRQGEWTFHTPDGSIGRIRYEEGEPVSCSSESNLCYDFLGLIN